MTTPLSGYELAPSASHRFFLYDPLGNGFLYYPSVEARDAAHQGIIQSYLDDAWNEEVEQIVAGEVTHTCEQVGREERPDASELNAEDCDRAGKYWGDWQYTCDYALFPLEPESVVDATPLPVTPAERLAAVSPFHPELPTVTREADHLVIRIGVNALCTAVTAADTWPMDGEGRVAQVTDQALFVRELASELLREDELGTTPLHRAFDEAADYLLENGCAAIEDLDDQDE